MTIQISGSIVALVTPFFNDRIDVPALQELVLWHTQQGTDAIVVAGSTGESLLLTDEEYEIVIRTAVGVMKTAKRRIPVIAGCGLPSTLETIQEAQVAERCGADALMIVAPCYVRPTQQGLLQHIRMIAQNVGLPLVIYNHPGRTGTMFQVETLLESCSENSNIIAIKDASSDLSRVMNLRLELPEHVTLLCGDDLLNLGYLAQGGSGIVSVTANVFPQLCKNFITAWKSGCVQEAFDLHKHLMKAHKAMGVEPNPSPVKYALFKIGKIKNEIRLPLLPIEEGSSSAQAILSAIR